MAGATATNVANTGVVTAVFPTTANAVISAAAIAGVIAPVVGATPVTTITAGTGYTGTVAWSGSPVTFAGNTAYTATITLTPATGYTLTGVAANLFTVAGATATNVANTGVVTAAFSATTPTLPAGYIVSGGLPPLTWAPINTGNATWSGAVAACTAKNAANTLGYSTGWRQPTKDELLTLYANRNSVTPSGWPPTGWTFGYTWSSTVTTPVYGAGSHYYVSLGNGRVDYTYDSGNYYVSCVH